MIKVPVGTQVFDAETHELVFDFTEAVSGSGLRKAAKAAGAMPISQRRLDGRRNFITPADRATKRSCSSS